MNYGVTVVKDFFEIEEEFVYYIEVDDILTGEVVETFEESFLTYDEADQFVADVVEKKYNIVSYHEKDLT